MSEAVVIDDVTKTFGSTTAVSALSLAVPRGSVYGFIGPNGSGKSTTLRMIMRIFHPDRGRSSVLGADATGAAASDRVGYLPEERGLYRKMKVYDLLKFYAELKSKRVTNAEIDRWLNRIDLAGVGPKPVEAMSKGMAQKVQFLTTVLHEPELLILDEPFSGLDPVNMEVLKDAILEQRKRGATIIFSTHDMDVAEKMCDFIFMIFKGKKVLDGTLASIQDRYGRDTIRVRVEGNGIAFDQLPGVERVNDFGQLQELRMTPGGDAQAVLAALVARSRVSHFEIAKPTLHDIFVRIAGPAAETAAGASAAGEVKHE
ncbi:MAG: ATP-binding cassette domain-containing protein [Planctomycetes bacterium]|nr:ATP-binding cassette domain-containing protein [Planctomycetota bacterium]